MTAKDKRKILVTSALPYANGDIHIGHLVEYLQTDFWVRYQKMAGHDCIYICADDTHGTPIMLRAQKEDITPEELVAQSFASHQKDFSNFDINFDYYGSTNSKTNKEYCESIFSTMEKNNHISVKKIEQAYSEQDKMFLPDRFVKGDCPKCNAPDQYGDSCDNCSATYSPLEMKNAKSAVSGSPITAKESEHIFFELGQFKQFLADWVPRHTPEGVAKKLKDWIDGDLKAWDISRDKPYFGFEIPGYKDKFFYVWVDAPVGYISSTKEYCDKENLDVDSYWRNNDCEIYHFIGKDIVYFHSLFWPAMLECSGYNKPSQIFVHGFLTVNGKKMSKSKGTFIQASTYLENLEAQYLRYYYACKLSDGQEDIDLNLEDFTQRVNSDLVGKIANLGSRGAQMLNKNFSGKLSEFDNEGKSIFNQAQLAKDEILSYYEKRQFSKAIQRIRDIADDANQFFDAKQPWKLIKEDELATQKILTVTMNIYRLIAIYLQPILPKLAQKTRQLLNEEGEYNWESLEKKLENGQINEFEPLVTRIDKKNVEKMVQQSQNVTIQKPKTSNQELGSTSSEKYIDFNDFIKVDLRIAKIESVEIIEEADKLLRIIADLGPLGKKNIIAGIRKHYSPEELIGKLVTVVANLQPRKMKFGTSEAMILAVGDDKGRVLSVLSPHKNMQPGDKIN